MMNREYLPLTGLSRDDVSLGNVIRCRPHHTNILPEIYERPLQDAILHCHQAHFKLPPKTRLIVAMGEYALFGMTQTGMIGGKRQKGHAISDWRGYLLPFAPVGTNQRTRITIWTSGPSDMPVLAVNHLALIFKDPSSSLLARRDWNKIPKILRGAWGGALV